MLILTRRITEEVIIAQGTPYEIRVTILGIKGNQVRIGFGADKNISIHRLEIAEKIEEEKKSSVTLKN